MDKKNWSTIIIGAGQAGLAAGYYLKKTGEDFIILDEKARIGDSWRLRWDSLKLFTPAQYDGLPGFPFPSPYGTCPGKNEMADYLEKYAEKFAIPVQTNTKVVELSKVSDYFEVTTSTGKFQSNNIIVTTGTNPVANIPSFAKELNKEIIQVHSSNYKNPQSFMAESTLVVGAGVSGVEIALELSVSRKVIISGNPTPHIPDVIFKYAGKPYWWFANHILTTGTPIGRKVKQKILHGGAPLISVSFDDIKNAGIEHLPRLSGIKNGFPQLEDGQVIQISSIVWATGFKPDFSWVKLDITDDTGWSVTKRGVIDKFKGLYFIGMLFQYGLTSGLVGGVGRDAEFVVNHLKSKK